MVNRSGNQKSSEGAAHYLDRAIELCRSAGFKDILLRGDTDFSQTRYLDGWDQDGVRFVFGFDARKNLKGIANGLDDSEYTTLEREAEKHLGACRARQTGMSLGAFAARSDQALTVCRGSDNSRHRLFQVTPAFLDARIYLPRLNLRFCGYRPPRCASSSANRSLEIAISISVKTVGEDSYINPIVASGTCFVDVVRFAVFFHFLFRGGLGSPFQSEILYIIAP